VLKKGKEREKNMKRELNNILTYEILMVRFENPPGNLTSVQSCISNVALGGKTACCCEPNLRSQATKIGKGNPLCRKAESWECHW
jgi:hypothetical protein